MHTHTHTRQRLTDSESQRRVEHEPAKIIKEKILYNLFPLSVVVLLASTLQFRLQDGSVTSLTLVRVEQLRVGALKD